MAKNRTNKAKKETAKIKNIILQVLTVSLIYASISAVSCLILFTVSIPDNVQFYFILALLSFSSFLTGFFAGRKKKKKGLLYALLYNAFPIVLLILLSLIFNKFSFDYRLFVSMTAMLILSAAGGISAVNSRKKNR